jgi:hypothetical protein
MHGFLSHDVVCGTWAQNTVVEKGIVDLEGEVERYWLTSLRNSVVCLVDEDRKLFKRVILRGKFNLFFLVLRRFKLHGGFLKEGNLCIDMRRTPLHFRRTGFNLKDFQKFRYSDNTVIKIFEVIFSREVNLAYIILEFEIPQNLICQILCFL